MEVLVITVWFYALVIVGTAFAASLMIKTILADDRYLAQYEPPWESAAEQQEQDDLALAA